MERIQFYPEEDLYQTLKSDADSHGVPISALISDILKKHYGLTEEDNRTEADITLAVFTEIRSYIESIQVGDEFDLAKASDTFRNIEMYKKGRPTAMRAKIGKSFAQKVGEPDGFPNISLMHTSKGNIKRNKNNAAIYFKSK